MLIERDVENQSNELKFIKSEVPYSKYPEPSSLPLAVPVHIAAVELHRELADKVGQVSRRAVQVGVLLPNRLLGRRLAIQNQAVGENGIRDAS